MGHFASGHEAKRRMVDSELSGRKLKALLPCFAGGGMYKERERGESRFCSGVRFWFLVAETARLIWFWFRGERDVFFCAFFFFFALLLLFRFVVVLRSACSFFMCDNLADQ